MVDSQIVRLLGSWILTRANYSASAQVGRLLTIAFVAAPRESWQDEVLLLQRRFTVRAHTARKRAQTKADEILVRLRNGR